MKNKILSILLALDGLLIAFGPISLFKLCPVGEKIMKCHWTGKSLLGLGVVISTLAILTLLNENNNFKRGIIFSLVINFILTIAMPLYLIGGCKKSDMPCQSLTYPCIYLLATIGIGLSIALYINLKKEP